MKTYSYFSGISRCDHEVRIIPLSLRQPILPGETTYNLKIKSDSHDNVDWYLKNYIESKKLEGIIFRTLPFIERSNYINSSRYLAKSSYSSSNIRSKAIIQIPHPKFVTISDFRCLVEDMLQYFIGFEVISGWHDKNIDDIDYAPYIDFCLSRNLLPCIEVDHSFRDSRMHLWRCLNVIRRHSIKRVWLPHLGCGLFLYPDLAVELNCDFILLSSVPKSLQWINLCRHIEAPNFRIAYASDTPYDGLQAFKTYDRFFNVFKQ